MQVKLFMSTNVAELQQEINDFLNLNNYEIIDIKFQAAEKDFSAMVIFKR